ncbi:MAG TPA: hypothetical protein VGI40_10315 [Pirellulaceae bacterium]|jgi:hypothetical protein
MMSTITAILEPDKDGSVHLPLPPELRNAPVKVTATLEAAPAGARPQFGCLAGKIELLPGFDDPVEEFREYMG